MVLPEPPPRDAVQSGPPALPPVRPDPPAVPLFDLTLLPPRANGVRLVSRLPTHQPVISLTFDVEAEPGPALAILSTLKAAQVRASFGLTGLFARANPDIVRRIVDEGHDLFNHTYSHPALTAIGPARRRTELQLMEDAVVSATGRKPLPVFRPPYGVHSPAVLRDIAATGYPWVLLWDVDPQGFRGYSPATIATEALRHAQAGSIILMHGIPQDAAALPLLVQGLKERGMGFVTVSEALGLR
jgi:peptidoglycan/xylan/chitin deacetylase (PgdA/CDA1 family)